MSQDFQLMLEDVRHRFVFLVAFLFIADIMLLFFFVVVVLFFVFCCFVLFLCCCFLLGVLQIYSKALR